MTIIVCGKQWAIIELNLTPDSHFYQLTEELESLKGNICDLIEKWMEIFNKDFVIVKKLMN